MQGISTRLRLDSHKTGYGFTELSVIIGSGNFRFCDGVDVRINDNDA